MCVVGMGVGMWRGLWCGVYVCVCGVCVPVLEGYVVCMVYVVCMCVVCGVGVCVCPVSSLPPE